MIDIEFCKEFVAYTKKLFNTNNFIPLHEPRFIGNEKRYLNKCIDSTFVSSVGEYVDLFEKKIAEFTGSNYAVATVNGTAALHISLILSDVTPGDEVITQALTFVATCNAIKYCNANPLFIDVDSDSMGLSPDSLKLFLLNNTIKKEGFCINKNTGNKIKACVPMHTFGLPCRIEEIKKICEEYNIALIEDSAESLGAYSNNIHTGNFGKMGVLSFNGNKIITSGGGGCIITNDKEIAAHAKHLTTTAKVPHKWEYVHDEVGFNYRMPNLNAALLCAQLEMLDQFLINKRELTDDYVDFFNKYKVNFVHERNGTKSNYWLNAIIFDSKKDRDIFLDYTNTNGVMTRPIWRLMSKLKMFNYNQLSNLNNSIYLEDRVVNIPSSVRVY